MCGFSLQAAAKPDCTELQILHSWIEGSGQKCLKSAAFAKAPASTLSRHVDSARGTL